jgi:restriction system protein
LLREVGFINVTVTGRSGDGGIDGKGVLRLGGLVSFNVFFQAKRYSGSVQPSVVRDFRGAIQGRADKGLVITTGTFTKAAKEEAQRDRAIAIDLIDGIQLAERLKEIKLGVSIRTVEEIQINKEWFESL